MRPMADPNQTNLQFQKHAAAQIVHMAGRQAAQEVVGTLPAAHVQAGKRGCCRARRHVVCGRAGGGTNIGRNVHRQETRRLSAPPDAGLRRSSFKPFSACRTSTALNSSLRVSSSSNKFLLVTQAPSIRSFSQKD